MLWSQIFVIHCLFPQNPLYVAGVEFHVVPECITADRPFYVLDKVNPLVLVYKLTWVQPYTNKLVTNWSRQYSTLPLQRILTFPVIMTYKTFCDPLHTYMLLDFLYYVDVTDEISQLLFISEEMRYRYSCYN